MPESYELSAEQCDRLLRGNVVGRVAVATPTGPHIVPVNYAVVDDAVVLRTTPYSVLGTYGRDAVLAFEVDHADHAEQHGWSVVVRGRAEAVTAAEDLERVRSAWSPRPWASGARTLVLRVPRTEVSGRRLGTGWSLESDSPVLRRLAT